MLGCVCVFGGVFGISAITNTLVNVPACVLVAITGAMKGLLGRVFCDGLLSLCEQRNG